MRRGISAALLLLGIPRRALPSAEFSDPAEMFVKGALFQSKLSERIA